MRGPSGAPQDDGEKRATMAAPEIRERLGILTATTGSASWVGCLASNAVSHDFNSVCRFVGVNLKRCSS